MQKSNQLAADIRINEYTVAKNLTNVTKEFHCVT